MSIAAGTASLINKDDLISIQKTRSNDTIAYTQIQQQLRTVRDDNRREDILLNMLYYCPKRKCFGEYEYLVDAEDKIAVIILQSGNLQMKLILQN